MERQMRKKKRKKKFKSVGKENENREKNDSSVKSVDAYANNKYSLKVKCSTFQNPYH